MSTTLTLWQQFREVLRETWRWQEALADRMDWWTIRSHSPDDVNGDQSRAVCLRCAVDWPCPETLAATDRIDSRHPEESA